MQLIGAVLMGGKSRRFGSDKALADADGIPLGTRVVTALRSAGLDPVVAVGGTAGSALGLITVPDRRPDAGPLAALASVLGWAGTGGVVVVPCDHPTVLSDDITRLIHAFRSNPEQAAVGVYDANPVIGLACWPATLSRPIQKLVDGDERRFQAALNLTDWTKVQVSAASTRDADDPAALRAALDAAEQPRE